jgi:hypothetical protein
MVIVKADSPMLELPKPTQPLLCDSAKLRGGRRARKTCPELVEGALGSRWILALLSREARGDESAKRKSGQPIENKQSREIIDSAHIMIPMTYDPARETFRFAWRNNSFRFRCFWPPRRPKRNCPVGPRRRPRPAQVVASKACLGLSKGRVRNCPSRRPLRGLLADRPATSRSLSMRRR